MISFFFSFEVQRKRSMNAAYGSETPKKEKKPQMHLPVCL